MNIIFTTISMRGGGTERVISILANRLVNRGHNVTILMIADPTIEYNLDERVQTLGITDTVGGSMSGRIKRLRGIRRIVKEAYRHITADSCIEENGDTRVIAMGTVASMFTLLATLGLRVPIIISERNDPNRLNHRPIKPIERMLRDLLYTRAARIVLQTRDAISCFSGKTARNCVIIPNPLPEAMPAPGDVNKRAKSIITAGRLTEQKNHKLLIEVFGRIADILPDYELKIFGKGELEDELQKLINERGLGERAHLCGFSDNLYGELASGGIYVSSSDWEGISNSLMEALAMGIPTVATDCPMGGSRMCIRDGENGFLVKPGDADAMADRIIRLATDSQLALRISQSAVAIRDEFSVDKILDMWLQPTT